METDDLLKRIVEIETYLVPDEAVRCGAHQFRSRKRQRTCAPLSRPQPIHGKLISCVIRSMNRCAGYAHPAAT